MFKHTTVKIANLSLLYCFEKHNNKLRVVLCSHIISAFNDLSKQYKHLKL